MQPSVAALVGRRVDPLDTEQRRFPLQNVPLVRERLERLFVDQKLQALVCAAACGADLIALEVAQKFSIRVHIVLPFEVERFRSMSVTDRPGNWGPIFDRVLSRLRAADTLKIVRGNEEDDLQRVLEQINIEILRAASSEERNLRRLAIVVWEGGSRGIGDLSNHLRKNALAQGFAIHDVTTS